MTSLENAAKAAYDDWIKDVGDLEPAWEELPESHRARLTDSIRAALTAVREPTEQMLLAGRFRPYDQAFTAMIGAILNDKGPAAP